MKHKLKEKQNQHSPTKSDYKDAKVIADLIRNGGDIIYR
jgi:hypothetical protein